MATLLWQRDLASDADGVKNTFSSWDACMSKAYCKWPVIICIIIGSLILLSLLWCAFRCLCCGLECCCGCLSCCNACCPSPRRKNKGYEQPPPPQYPSYPQYQSHPAPTYGQGDFTRGGYRGPQTATFDAPNKSNRTPMSNYNEDALPSMPSWDTAASKHVEEEDVEMEKLDHDAHAQQERLLSHQDGRTTDNRYYGYPHQDSSQAGDLGAAQSGPYHNYDQHQQYAASPVSDERSAYQSMYSMSPPSTVYEPTLNQYAHSVAPSYHTTYTPPQRQMQMDRKPVQGTWRDI